MADSVKIAELQKRLQALKAKDIMTRSIIPAREDMTLADYARMLLDKRISGTPIVDDNGKLTGVITATDLFSLMYVIKSGEIVENDTGGVFNPTVGFAMTRDVISVTEETTFEETMRLMVSRNVHTLPVVNGDKLVGIIGRRDIIKHFYGIVKDLFGSGSL